MPMLLSDFVLFSFVVVLIAGLLLAFSGGSFAYRAQNPATVYVAPGRGFAFSYRRALSRMARALCRRVPRLGNRNKESPGRAGASKVREG